MDGLSAGLGSKADQRVFGMLRRLADVVLVGAGTVRAEDYRGARRPTRDRDTPRPVASGQAADDTVRRRVDLVHTTVLAVGDPQRTVPVSRRGRLTAECSCEVPSIIDRDTDQVVTADITDDAGDLVARVEVRWRLRPAVPDQAPDAATAAPPI